MDEIEFSRRLRKLAGASADDLAALEVDAAQILGRLGFACAVRRGQAVALALAFGVLSYVSLRAMEGASAGGQWGGLLALAGITLTVLRHFPYWTPAKPLREGLLALSQYPLNDLGQFLAHQRTSLTAVNNTLLSDLCMQLVMDRRRPKVPALTSARAPE